jgi:hypothetical protein
MFQCVAQHSEEWIQKNDIFYGSGFQLTGWNDENKFDSSGRSRNIETED